MWDVGGQGRIRVLWRHYIPNTDGEIVLSYDPKTWTEISPQQRLLVPGNGMPFRIAIIVHLIDVAD